MKKKQKLTRQFFIESGRKGGLKTLETQGIEAMRDKIRHARSFLTSKKTVPPIDNTDTDAIVDISNE